MKRGRFWQGEVEKQRKKAAAAGAATFGDTSFQKKNLKGCLEILNCRSFPATWSIACFVLTHPNVFDSQAGIQSSALQVRRGPEALHQFVLDLRATCTQILNAQTGSTFSVSLKFIKSDADIILGRTCMSSLILELYINGENFIFPAFSFSVMAKFVGGCELHALHLRYSSLEILQALRKVSNFHRKQPDCDCNVVGSELIVKEKRLLPEHAYVGMNIKKKTLQSILLSSATTKNSILGVGAFC